MSAAIDRIGMQLARTYARLKATHWASEERKASLACVAAMGRGERLESRAHEVWAEICAHMSRTWNEEAERTS